MKIELNEKLLKTNFSLDEIFILSSVLSGNLPHMYEVYKYKLDCLEKHIKKLEGNLYISNVNSILKPRPNLLKLLDFDVDINEDPDIFFKTFNELFPTISNYGGDRILRANIKDLRDKYVRYDRKYKWDKDKVLKVTKKYIEDELSKSRGIYIMNASYFIHKQGEGSKLAALYDAFDENEPIVNNSFTEKL